MKSKHLGETVLSPEEIQDGIKIVADMLNQQYQDAVILSVVPGGILFTADLVRELTFDIRMDYISCPHTPGDRENSSEIVYHQNIPIDGQDVIVIDDALESGGTMRRLVEHLSLNYKMKSLSIATLLVKPSRVEIPARQFYAYDVATDELLVGYGLPWRDKLRNVPYVAKLVK